MRRRELRGAGIPLGGLIAMTTGTLSPLFRVNPSRPADAPVPLGYALEQSSGLGGIDFALLVAACLVGATLIVDCPRVFRGALTVLTGILAVVFPTHYLLGSTFGFGATATFVPALGWYGTVVGGTLLVIAGGYHLRGRHPCPAASTTRGA